MLAAALVALVLAVPANADSPLTKPGQCAATTIAEISTRLENTPGSGSAVSFANGIDQVSYDTITAIEASRVGDPVTLCLVSLPKNCPPGDNRGIRYKATNLRTKGSWTLGDSEHMCGGA
jgi:hypothetical protein